VISGEGLIATCGGIDSHVHFNFTIKLLEDALFSGITTLLGGGTGPATGSYATTATPGIWNIEQMLRSLDAFPINIGICGKGNSSSPNPLVEQIGSGIMGLNYMKIGVRHLRLLITV